MPPTDPLIYRLYELVMVNRPALKALIEEEFGDGIMSAIDFDLAVDRLPNPKGDRVRLVLRSPARRRFKARVGDHPPGRSSTPLTLCAISRATRAVT
jgi:hypothetical protein